MSNNNLVPNYGIMKNGNKNNINSFNEESLIQNQILQNKTSRNKYSKDDDINNSFPDIQLLKDLSIPSFVDDFFGILDNTFIVFKSINEIIHLICSNKNKSIMDYNLIDFKLINEIKMAHFKFITNFRHYYDTDNKLDLIISISSIDNNIKLWNANNWDCLYNFMNLNKSGTLFSGCFLNDNKNNYILTSNFNILKKVENIKIFDFNGNKIKEIKDSNFNTYFIDCYYDNNLSKNFIITGNSDLIRAYDYNNNEIYKKYYEMRGFLNAHFSIVVYKDDNSNDIKLISSSFEGCIKIFNFHTGILLSKIEKKDTQFFGICLWNQQYLFCGSKEGSIYMADIINGKFAKNIEASDYDVITLKTISHPFYGKCMISQGILNKGIKIWTNKTK
jgi:WD40 repeat protein